MTKSNTIKTRSRILSIVMSALLAVTLLVPLTGNDALARKQMPAKRVMTLPSKYVGKYRCTKIDGMVFVGKDLWYLKSANGPDSGKPAHKGCNPMILYRVKNFAKQKKKKHVKVQAHAVRYKNKALYHAKHSSSISYFKGNFYIVTLGTYNDKTPIIKVNKKGIIQNKIKISGFHTKSHGESFQAFSCMTFYGKNKKGQPQFICRDGKQLGVGSKERHVFTVGTLKGNTLKGTNYNCYISMNKKSDVFPRHIRCNDIGYDVKTKKLYHSAFVHDKGGNITRNWVYTYKIKKVKRSKQDRFVQSGKPFFLSPVKQLAKHKYFLKKVPNITKFEIEGLDTYKGTLYMGANTDRAEDGLYVRK